MANVSYFPVSVVSTNPSALTETEIPYFCNCCPHIHRLSNSYSIAHKMQSSPLLSRPLFLGSLSLLLTHEMDAVRQSEWRILFPFSLISDDSTAFQIFTAAHIPLYIGLLHVLASKHSSAHTTATALSIFAIGHAGVHAFFRYKQWGDFSSTFSKMLIHGAALLSVADLALLARKR